MNLSATTDFPSLWVEYISMSFFSNYESGHDLHPLGLAHIAKIFDRTQRFDPFKIF